MIPYNKIDNVFRKKSGISINEYVICDIVYILSSNKNNKFMGWCYMSKKNMALEMDVSERTIFKYIEKLIQIGLLEKDSQTGYLRTTRKWDIHLISTDHHSDSYTMQNMQTDYAECADEPMHNMQRGYAENADYTKKETKRETKIKEKETPNEFGSLFPDESKEKLTLFKNCKASDFNFFEKQFSQKEFEQVDLNYYFHSVKDWSDQSNKKRTLSGWIATVRNWMRRDNENKKLKLKKTGSYEMDPDLIDYLKI